MKKYLAILTRFSVAVLALLFVAAGLNHFLNPKIYLSIMPPYLPAPLTLIYISGFFEILGGVGILFSATRWAAGWGLMALLVAVFPANIHMALHASQFERFPVWLIMARLPLQFVIMAWVYEATIRQPKNSY